jgi:hypothetical protein
VLSEYEESQDDLIGRWFDKNLAKSETEAGQFDIVAGLLTE